MEAQTKRKMINIFSVSDKDVVRTVEQHHESLLKKRLLEMGIVVDFDRILHHGINGINKFTEIKNE
jgi:hypothetical protein